MSTIRRKYNSNEIVVNNKSYFKSHLVKCQKLLDNIQFDEIRLKAMGKAVSRANCLATQLNKNNFDTLNIRQKTMDVTIHEDKTQRPLRGANKDSFNPDAIDVTKTKDVSVPAIEITIRKHALEIERLNKTRKSDKDLKFKHHG